MKVTLLKSGDQSEPQTVATGPRPTRRTLATCFRGRGGGRGPGQRPVAHWQRGELSLGGGSSEPAVAGAEDIHKMLFNCKYNQH